MSLDFSFKEMKDQSILWKEGKVGKPVPFTEEKLRKFIGFSTNVNNKTPKQFVKDCAAAAYHHLSGEWMPR